MIEGVKKQNNSTMQSKYIHLCLNKLFNSFLSRVLLKATRQDARQALAIKTIFLGLKVAFYKLVCLARRDVAVK